MAQRKKRNRTDALVGSQGGGPAVAERGSHTSGIEGANRSEPGCTDTIFGELDPLENGGGGVVLEQAEDEDDVMEEIHLNSESLHKIQEEATPLHGNQKNKKNKKCKNDTGRSRKSGGGASTQDMPLDSLDSFVHEKRSATAGGGDLPGSDPAHPMNQWLKKHVNDGLRQQIVDITLQGYNPYRKLLKQMERRFHVASKKQDPSYTIPPPTNLDQEPYPPEVLCQTILYLTKPEDYEVLSGDWTEDGKPLYGRACGAPTLKYMKSAIGYWHRQHQGQYNPRAPSPPLEGKPHARRSGNPMTDPQFINLYMGTLKQLEIENRGVKRSADPFNYDHLLEIRRQTISSDKPTAWGLCMYTKILVGSRLFLRTRNVCALNFGNVIYPYADVSDRDKVPDRLQVEIFGTKTTQGKRMELSLWAYHDFPEICPVRHLLMHMQLLKELGWESQDPLFPRFQCSKGFQYGRPKKERHTYDSYRVEFNHLVDSVFKGEVAPRNPDQRITKRNQLDQKLKRFTTHTLRHTGAFLAAVEGGSLIEIKHAGIWLSDVVLIYITDGQHWRLILTIERTWYIPVWRQIR